MATKLVHEPDSAQCLEELPYYNRIEYPFPPPRPGIGVPSKNRREEWQKQYDYNIRWNNPYQSGYKPCQIRKKRDREYQTPQRFLMPPMEAKAHNCPNCQFCPKAPKRQQDEDTPPIWFIRHMENYTLQQQNDTPPLWFTNWMEANMASQEDEDTPPTWFTDYMAEHKHDCLDSLTKKVRENKKQIKILLIESSVIIKGMDRINRTLKAERTYPIRRPTTSNKTEPLLDTDKELAILANEID